MEKYYWYKVCPICDGQGRLFLMEDISRERIYLHCEECEFGFLEPLKLKSEKNFLTLSDTFKYKFADYKTIEKYGWKEFALNQIQEDLVPNI